LSVKIFIQVVDVATFWDIWPCSPYVNRRLRETYHLHLWKQISVEQEISVQQVAKQNSSSETSVHIRTTRLYIPKESSIHIYRCENLKSYSYIN
jgi:hypothetical protein